ncbi:hypothetical protein [Streptomyces cyaneofuscatus]|uniref:hypothetical protein n=1 Tax=Streptomyces cyaneofuscatus TaxID=66883 RepID=UPI003823D375
MSQRTKSDLLEAIEAIDNQAIENVRAAFERREPKVISLPRVAREALEGAPADETYEDLPGDVLDVFKSNKTHNNDYMNDNQGDTKVHVQKYLDGGYTDDELRKHLKDVDDESISKLDKHLKETRETLVNNLHDKKPEIQNKAIRGRKGTCDTLGGVWSDICTKLDDWLTSVIDEIGEWFNKAINDVGNWFKNLFGF